MKHKKQVIDRNVIGLESDIRNALAQKQFFGNGKVSILVIDDNEVFSRFLKLAISSEFENALVQVCHSGQEAITHILDFPPDLLILDLNMPKLDGFKVAKIINDIYEYGIPILFVSANRNVENEIKALPITSASDFLSKPIDKNKLNQKISELIKKAA